MIFLATLAAQIILLMALIALMFILLRSVINGAIYFPSKNKNVAVMVQLLNIRPGEKIADLGSGDGKIVIALAQAGAEAHGYETNPILVYWSRKKIRAEGLEKKAFVHYQSFWKTDLSKFDAITIYGFPNFFKKLCAKMQKEMKPGVRVVSNLYELPDLMPIQKTEEKVYLYILREKT